MITDKLIIEEKKKQLEEERIRIQKERERREREEEQKRLEQKRLERERELERQRQKRREELETKRKRISICNQIKSFIENPHYENDSSYVNKLNETWNYGMLKTPDYCNKEIKIELLKTEKVDLSVQSWTTRVGKISGAFSGKIILGWKLINRHKNENGQSFYLHHFDDGYYLFQEKGGGVIDLYGPQTNNGATIGRYDRNNGNNQQWKLVVHL